MTRRLILLALMLVSVAAVAFVSSGNSAASTCSAKNRTTSKVYADLQPAISEAASGATLAIQGTCYGNFTIDKSLTLLGRATLDGNRAGTVLHITNGTTAIQKLTITHGLANVEAFLFNDGQSQKLCCSGGGIAVEGAGAAAILTDSLVTDNAAPPPWGRAGGIDVNEGTLTLNNSIVSNNRATNAAGINADIGTVTLNGSTVSGNEALGEAKFCQATASCGGGIWSYGSVLTLNNSTIIQNKAGWRGGGIVNQAGVLTLRGRTTITANEALYSTRKLPAAGGGIYQRGGTITLDGWTGSLSGNTPDQCFEQTPDGTCSIFTG